MAKFITEQYGNRKEILKFPDHYVALAVTVDDEGVVANEDGKKIVPAGTIIGGKEGSILENETDVVVNKNTPELAAGAEGVLFRDVDVTYGKAAGSMIIHGFIAEDKLPEKLQAGVKEALKQIHFIK